MKKIFNKVKLWLSAFWVAIISFFSRVFWENFGMEQNLYMDQNLYWVPQLEYWVPSPMSSALIVSKIAQRLLIWVTLIVWIVNLIKIRKTEDKTEKKERLKRFIIIISILLVLIAACLVIVRLLKR